MSISIYGSNNAGISRPQSTMVNQKGSSGFHAQFEKLKETLMKTDTVTLSDPAGIPTLQDVYEQLSDESKDVLSRMKAGQSDVDMAEWINLCRELKDAGVITEEDFSNARPDMKLGVLPEPGLYWSPAGVDLHLSDDVEWEGDPLKYLDEWMASLGKLRTAWAVAIGPDGNHPTEYVNELNHCIGSCAKVANVVSNIMALA